MLQYTIFNKIKSYNIKYSSEFLSLYIYHIYNILDLFVLLLYYLIFNRFMQFQFKLKS